MRLLNVWMRACRAAALARCREQRGQGLVEYALIIGLIAVASVAVLGTFAVGVQGLFNTAIPFP